MLLISQFVANQICSHVTDLLSFVSLAFLCNPADFLPDYLFHLQRVPVNGRIRVPFYSLQVMPYSTK